MPRIGTPISKAEAGGRGDPGRVTLFGQSSGGDLAARLMVCDAARGLFHRVIVQSAPLDLPLRAGRMRDGMRTQEQAMAIAAYIASVQPAAHGKELVELNCSPCHAVGTTGDSPHPDAPRFRELSERYPIEALEEAFVEGIETGHPDMPSFVATPDQIADIISYIESIQAK